MVAFDDSKWAGLDEDLNELMGGSTWDMFEVAQHGANIDDNIELDIEFAGGKEAFVSLNKNRFVSFSISTWEKKSNISKLLKQLSKRTDDLSPVLKAIGNDFFRTNKKLIFSESPGRFDDLKIGYKFEKSKYNSIYPILVRSGALQRSLTLKTDSDAIFKVYRKSIRLGTKIDYAYVHQHGRRDGSVPARPPVDIEVGNRIQKWSDIIRKVLLS